MIENRKEIFTVIMGLIGVNLIYLPYKIQLVAASLVALYLITFSIYRCTKGKDKNYIIVRLIVALLMILVSADIICENILVKYSKYGTFILALIALSILSIIIILFIKSHKEKHNL